MAQAVEDYPERYSLPSEEDNIYTWPKDLLLPDRVFFLEVSEKVRRQRIGGRQELTMQEHLIEARTIFRKK